MSASSYYKEANGHYLEEEYKRAATLYDQAITLDTTQFKYYLHRAFNHIQLENYLDAIFDCDKALELNSECHKAWLKRGVACFNLEEYEASFLCFKQAKKDGNNCDLWIKKCKAELKRESKMSGFELPSVLAEPAPPPKKKLVRLNWNQSDVTITITLFVKKLTEEDVTIKCEEKKLHVTLRLPNSKSWIKDWFLWGPVEAEKMRFSVSPYKIEIILYKVTRGEHFDTLEDAEHHKDDFDETDNIVGDKQMTDGNLKSASDWHKLFKHIYAQNDSESQGSESTTA